MRAHNGNTPVSTLVNILCWVWSSVDTEGKEISSGDSFDAELSRRGESFIRNAIAWGWTRFAKLVDSVADSTSCGRAQEAPLFRPRSGTYDLTIHEDRCRDGKCNNADFLNSQIASVRAVRDRLREMESGGVKLTDELKRCREMLDLAIEKPSILHDYSNCLALGDLWIHLECARTSIRRFVTTNYKESQILCPILGLELVNPSADPPTS